MARPGHDLFHDLLNLEINTIVKPGMTARKMPDPGHAILDVFSDYDLYLCGRAAFLNPRWAEFLGNLSAEKRERLGSSLPADSPLMTKRGLIDRLESTAFFTADKEITSADFDVLRHRARMAEEMVRTLILYGLLDDDGTTVMLKRIYRNSDQLKGILDRRSSADSAADSAQLQRLGWMRRRRVVDAVSSGISRNNAEADLALSAQELIVLRKAWEVGTEKVLMQTVAQLDGDIVTRVVPERLGTQNEGLRELHRMAVANSYEHWQFLIRTVEQITTSAAGFFLK